MLECSVLLNDLLDSKVKRKKDEDEVRSEDSRTNRKANQITRPDMQTLQNNGPSKPEDQTQYLLTLGQQCEPSLCRRSSLWVYLHFIECFLCQILCY